MTPKLDIYLVARGFGHIQTRKNPRKPSPKVVSTLLFRQRFFIPPSAVDGQPDAQNDRCLDRLGRGASWNTTPNEKRLQSGLDRNCNNCQRLLYCDVTLKRKKRKDVTFTVKKLYDGWSTLLENHRLLYGPYGYGVFRTSSHQALRTQNVLVFRL